MSQNSPPQPFGQKHLNESISSVQVPPFLQGFPRQSFMSKKEGDMFKKLNIQKNIKKDKSIPKSDISIFSKC